MLKGKSAIVTGSTSGIGKGIAEALAGSGVNVMLNGFGDAAEIERQRAALASATRVEVAYHPADMSKPADIRDMIASAEKTFGGVDILVNNAGIQHVAPIEQFPDDKWDAIIAINLSSAFHAIKAALPGMRARKWGRIINIASAHGLVASAEKSAYVSAKHGIMGLTKTVGLETAGSGITCVAICPGWVLTPLVQKQIDAKAAAEDLSPEAAKMALVGEKQPSKEFTTPEQIGQTVLFLCSPAADQITGSAISLDGGWVSQ
ncbi:3-hydroxybutyrate dehydrogenase [Dongia deserti]|uniref:3-hydroxybutyrate dehydrogenase n=1 Tax=Dongia deserti TaxID=2268030 RepID=UPI000E64FCE5|nr:3-hydroxybutyrate dehydrogenase [Dongia deserti]